MSAVVTFYFNVKSREQALCQLIGKALAQRIEINVLARDANGSAALDRLLWEIPQTGFLPHCAADDALAARTPIVVDHRDDLMQPRAALFNWTDAPPPEALRQGRIFEIVDRDDANRNRARERWRAYAALGITPSAIDMLDLAAARSETP
ncbi:DNA polymerase III subunit chi [Chitinolyticbacter meiyuanensis]|uniref:DNA polymerase III subunit chi n=1 Tax=Chitinolyticbacter meiyuanensis TaxID=682798 RepID=UPI0011E5F235|nr:DNA polymerase III subunit chi [Chitinolyticbacter meiyuanensis]